MRLRHASGCLVALHFVSPMLILIAHGSRDPRWRAALEQLTESLQAEVGRDAVRLAYMDLTPPTLLDVVAEAVRLGSREIRVLPLFLTEEGHVERNILPLVDRVRQAHPSAYVEILPAVGRLPQFRNLLRDIALRKAR